MKVIVIREVVDPEERKLRLRKIARYASRHAHHTHALRGDLEKALSPLKPMETDPKTYSLFRQMQPHKRRYKRATEILTKFGKKIGSLPKTKTYGRYR